MRLRLILESRLLLCGDSHFFWNIKVAAGLVLHLFLLLLYLNLFCVYVQFMLFLIALGHILLTLRTLEVIPCAHGVMDSELCRFNLLLASLAEACFCWDFHHFSDKDNLKYTILG